jgi:hypothetical protein
VDESIRAHEAKGDLKASNTPEPNQKKQHG